MSTRRWKKFALAACLSLCTAFAYQALASAETRPQVRPAPKAMRTGAVLHGRRLVAFAGYELNIAFTPDGKLLCLDITAAPAKKSAEGSKA